MTLPFDREDKAEYTTGKSVFKSLMSKYLGDASPGGELYLRELAGILASNPEIMLNFDKNFKEWSKYYKVSKSDLLNAPFAHSKEFEELARIKKLLYDRHVTSKVARQVIVEYGRVYPKKLPVLNDRLIMFVFLAIKGSYLEGVTIPRQEVWYPEEYKEFTRKTRSEDDKQDDS